MHTVDRLELPMAIIKWTGGGTVRRVPRAVALGMFDGVHIGHRCVISRVAGASLPDGTPLTAAVFTFSQPIRTNGAGGGCKLITAEMKRRSFEGLGVDEWITADFDRLRDMTPERFVDEFLAGELDARQVSCGFNYRFGAGGKGDAVLLRELCERRGITVTVAEPVESDGVVVSSTRIRKLIEDGCVEEANRLFGRTFTIDFEVVGGQRLGRLLGTPTINQPLPSDFIHPRFGVYAAGIEIDGRIHHGVTNIGVRPSKFVESTTENFPIAETWIAEYAGDLYGKNIPVSLIKFLRPEQCFDSLEALQKQILADAREARGIVFGDGVDGSPRAVLFDFDDTLQDRRAAFLGFCEWFMEKYFLELPPKEAEHRCLDMLERNNGGYVKYLDYFASLIDSWRWGNAPSPEELYHEFQFRFPEHTTLFPDTVEVLKALKARGFLVGIVTNGPSVLQNRKLDVSGLRPLLDITVVSGDEHVHKPDPEIFRRAALRLGVPCGDCVFVGDHPVNDIQGAVSAGMHPVYIEAGREGGCPENVPEIRSLPDLLYLV